MPEPTLAYLQALFDEINRLRELFGLPPLQAFMPTTVTPDTEVAIRELEGVVTELRRQAQQAGIPLPEGTPSPPAPTEPEPLLATEGLTEIIPGELAVLPDGTYVNIVTGYEVDSATAQQMISDYQTRFATTEGITEYQQATLDLRQQELDWQMRQQPTQTYAQYKQQLLSELTSPRDWITRWQVEHDVGGERRQSAQRATALDRQIAQAPPISSEQLAAGKAFQQFGQFPEAQGFLPEVSPSTMEQIVAAGQAAKAWQKYDELASVEPQNAPTPDWLRQFLTAPTGRRGREGQIPATGEPIEKLRIQTPSLQQWARTPPSQQQGLWGFADWAGFRSPEDILGQMAMMAPQAPAGAGRQRWLPARQRA